MVGRDPAANWGSAAVRSQGADDLPQIGDAGFVEQAGQVIEQGFRDAGIVKGCRAHLDGRCPRDQELKRPSSALAIPPMPMMGNPGSARATSQTIQSAIGLMAGPLRPPMSLARIGRRHRQSTAMPLSVLIRLTASAPASAAAAAIGTRSVTLGVSLAMTGSGQAARTLPPASHGRGTDSQVESVAHIWTGDIEFDRGQTGLIAEHLRHGDELVFVFAGDVGDHRRARGGR